MRHQTLQEWCEITGRIDLLQEWDYEKNSSLGFFPDKVGRAGKDKVWWICSRGHLYDAVIANRTRRNDGCPYCSGHRLLVGFNDLKTVLPEMCKEWDYEKNQEAHDFDVLNGVKNPRPAQPSELLWGSRTKVFWKCSEGHEFYISPSGRKVNISGEYSKCNKCANSDRTIQRRKTVSQKRNLGVLVPQSVDEWINSEHGLSPFDVSCYSAEIVTWKCKKGHVFQKPVNERVAFLNGRFILRQCGECSRYHRTSIAEQICYFYIKSVFPDAINTYKSSGYELDIYIPSIRTAVEFDGSYAHRNRLERDNAKDKMAVEDDIALYRFRPEALPDTNFASRITISETNEGVIAGLRKLFKLLDVDSPIMDVEKDYDQIIELFHERIGLTVAETDLIQEWDYTNNSIDPRYLSAKESHIQAWWICPECHNSYKSYPYNRYVRHTKCPNCSRKHAVRKNKKKIINFETGEVFDSIMDAERKYSTGKNTCISACCRGKTKTAYGYTWKYYEEK